jgi:acyl carrier protein
VLRKHYDLTIESNSERTRDHFRSINTLAALIEAQRDAKERVAATIKTA